MNQITRIKLEKYCKMINEIDPLFKLKLTKRYSHYYMTLDVKYHNTKMKYRIGNIKDEYLIENEDILMDRLQEIYQTVIST